MKTDFPDPEKPEKPEINPETNPETNPENMPKFNKRNHRHNLQNRRTDSKLVGKFDTAEDDEFDRAVDWESVRRDYRANILSLAAIARAYCPEGMQDRTFYHRIIRMVERYGWRRDLSQAVRLKAREELVRGDGGAEISGDIEADHAQDDDEIVSAAAALQVAVQRTHRADLQNARRLVAKLMHRAEMMVDKVGRGNLIKDFATLRDAVNGVESLVRSTSRLIPLERQAFSLDGSIAKDTDAISIEKRVMKHASGDGGEDGKPAAPETPSEQYYKLENRVKGAKAA